MNQKLNLTGMIALIAIVSKIVISAYFKPVKAHLSWSNGANGVNGGNGGHGGNHNHGQGGNGGNGGSGSWGICGTG
jgi:hypothetical protein